MNRRLLGRAYAAVTSTLPVAITVSWWCFQSYQARPLNMDKACVFIWAASGVLLGVSQVAFLVSALRLKESDQRVDRLKLVILVFAGGLLLMIAAFVVMLSNMPS
jgi:hypothetical protein